MIFFARRSSFLVPALARRYCRVRVSESDVVSEDTLREKKRESWINVVSTSDFIQSCQSQSDVARADNSYREIVVTVASPCWTDNHVQIANDIEMLGSEAVGLTCDSRHFDWTIPLNLHTWHQNALFTLAFTWRNDYNSAALSTHRQRTSQFLYLSIVGD